MRTAFLCIMVGTVLFSACGDDDPTGPAIPNLVGTYEGTWTQTIEGSGLETTTEECPGTVTVSEQSGGVFEGTFSQTATETCSAGDGFVTGAVTADGTLTVLLGASGGGGPAFEESTGCTIVSAEGSYTGAYAGGQMEFETSLIARCPDTGSTDVIYSWAFASS